VTLQEASKVYLVRIETLAEHGALGCETTRNSFSGAIGGVKVGHSPHVPPRTTLKNRE